jgi:hypothetical protein
MMYWRKFNVFRLCASNIEMYQENLASPPQGQDSLKKNNSNNTLKIS